MKAPIIVEQSIKRKIAIPEEVANVPLLWSVSEPFWSAWTDLQRSRPMVVGFGAATIAPIPYSEISTYARDMGWHDLEALLYVLTELENEWQACQPKKTDRNGKRRLPK